MPAPLIKILDEHKLRQQSVEGFREDFRICGGIIGLQKRQAWKQSEFMISDIPMRHYLQTKELISKKSPADSATPK